MTSTSSSFRGRSCRPPRARCRASSTASPACTRPSSRSCSSRPTARSRPAASGNLNAARRLPRRRAGTRPGPGPPRTRSSGRSRGCARSQRSSRARSRSRAHVPRGRQPDPDRGRDRDERDPRPGRRERQLPLRAGPLAGERRRLSPGLCPGRGASTSIAGDSPPARSSPTPLVQQLRRGRRPRARAEAGVDERRRLHRARDRRGQLRPGRAPATRTAATNASRSPRSCGPTSRCARSSPVASDRADLARPRSARRRIRSCG